MEQEPIITGWCEGCRQEVALLVGTWTAAAGSRGWCRTCADTPAGRAAYPPQFLPPVADPAPPRLPFRLLPFPLAKAVCAHVHDEC